MAMVIDLVPALCRRAGAEGLLALRQGLHGRAARVNGRLCRLWASRAPDQGLNWPAYDEETQSITFSEKKR
jgi:hypothetical protein